MLWFHYRNLLTGDRNASTGICLQDDFKIIKKIATGGFGTVYRAELDDGQTPGGRPVIIKKVGPMHVLSFRQSSLCT